MYEEKVFFRVFLFFIAVASIVSGIVALIFLYITWDYGALNVPRDVAALTVFCTIVLNIWIAFGTKKVKL